MTVVCSGATSVAPTKLWTYSVSPSARRAGPAVDLALRRGLGLGREDRLHSLLGGTDLRRDRFTKWWKRGRATTAGRLFGSHDDWGYRL